MRPNRPDIAEAHDGWLGRFVPWVIIAALMLLSRPYPGLHHDGILYAAQVLARLDTGDVGQDLIFAFGNQDSFSLFTRIYAPVVAAVGLPAATVLTWLVVLVVWTAALAMLVGRLFSDQRGRFMAMAAALLLAPNYGNGILSYGEAFITARPFAEALGMLAIAFSLRRSFWLSTGLVLLCGLMHPLTGIGVAAIWAWLSVGTFRQFVAVSIIGVALAFVLALFAGPPFSWLLEQVDPEWRQLMMDQSALAFASTWGTDGLVVLMLPMTCLGIVVWRGEAHHARPVRGVLAIAGLLLMLSVLAADVLGNKLLSMVQVWRVLLWPVLLGNVLAVAAYLTLPDRGLSRPVLAAALILNVAEHLLGILPASSAVMAGLAALTVLAETTGSPFLARWGQRVCAILAMLAGFAGITLVSSHILGRAGEGPDLILLVRLLFVGAAMAVLLLSVMPFIRVLAACLAFVGAILLCDARPYWQGFANHSDPLPDEIAQAVTGRQVYWEDGLELMWFKLHQPQFYSCRQKAGGLFFREQAEEVARRAGILKVLNTSDFSDDPAHVCPLKDTPGAIGPHDPAALRSVCSALPELDLIVLKHQAKGMSVAPWILPADAKFSHASEEVYPYECSAFRG